MVYAQHNFGTVKQGKKNISSEADARYYSQVAVESITYLRSALTEHHSSHLELICKKWKKSENTSPSAGWCIFTGPQLVLHGICKSTVFHEGSAWVISYLPHEISCKHWKIHFKCTKTSQDLWRHCLLDFLSAASLMISTIQPYASIPHLLTPWRKSDLAFILPLLYLEW